jgi:CheY-like chemotaxis protein
VIARDGAEGVAMAESEAPALVLMDMSLPVMDGWDATKVIKATPATHDIPVIGVTAHAMTGDREKAIEAGCDDYVTKPVDMAQLLGKVDRLLGRGNSRLS